MVVTVGQKQTSDIKSIIRDFRSPSPVGKNTATRNSVHRLCWTSQHSHDGKRETRQLLPLCLGELNLISRKTANVRVKRATYKKSPLGRVSPSPRIKASSVRRCDSGRTTQSFPPSSLGIISGPPASLLPLVQTLGFEIIQEDSARDDQSRRAREVGSR